MSCLQLGLDEVDSGLLDLLLVEPVEVLVVELLCVSARASERSEGVRERAAGSQTSEGRWAGEWRGLGRL